jgi:xanthine/CO dehydrogenase XdhC/CoxF family maturation factor
MGCEGVVHILLERLRPEERNAGLGLLAACHAASEPGVLASMVKAGGDVKVGEHVVVWPDGRVSGSIGDEALTAEVTTAAQRSLETGTGEHAFTHRGEHVEVVLERIDPPPALVLFGAGDDAMPVVAIAKELGWHVTVADGRAHYANATRFARADRVTVTRLAAPLAGISLPKRAACVVMSHSFEQDRAVLAALAQQPVAYIGLLGPRARTQTLLDEIGSPGLACPSGLHNPVGLDIGSASPESIALAIVAEVQAVLAGRDGRPLRERPERTEPDR